MPPAAASPWAPLVRAAPALAAAYAAFALALGPRLMRARRPLRPRAPLVAYNALQLALNAALLARSVALLADARYDLACPRAARALAAAGAGGAAFAQEVIHVAYCQSALRILDVVDTVFLVLAKKNSHLTGLHIYHHASMIVSCWLCIQLDPAVATGFMALAVNNLVHFFMYSYYLLSLLGFPSVHFVKKYLTRLQLLQFVGVGLYTLQAALREDCDTSMGIASVNLFQSVAFFALFLQFYWRAYASKEKV